MRHHIFVILTFTVLLGGALVSNAWAQPVMRIGVAGERTGQTAEQCRGYLLYFSVPETRHFADRLDMSDLWWFLEAGPESVVDISLLRPVTFQHLRAWFYGSTADNEDDCGGAVEVWIDGQIVGQLTVPDTCAGSDYNYRGEAVLSLPEPVSPSQVRLVDHAENNSGSIILTHLDLLRSPELPQYPDIVRTYGDIHEFPVEYHGPGGYSYSVPDYGVWYVEPGGEPERVVLPEEVDLDDEWWFIGADEDIYRFTLAGSLVVGVDLSTSPVQPVVLARLPSYPDSHYYDPCLSAVVVTLENGRTMVVSSSGIVADSETP